MLSFPRWQERLCFSGVSCRNCSSSEKVCGSLCLNMAVRCQEEVLRPARPQVVQLFLFPPQVVPPTFASLRAPWAKSCWMSGLTWCAGSIRTAAGPSSPVRWRCCCTLCPLQVQSRCGRHGRGRDEGLQCKNVKIQFGATRLGFVWFCLRHNLKGAFALSPRLSFPRCDSALPAGQAHH